jgi:hypothetical protein
MTSYELEGKIGGKYKKGLGSYSLEEDGEYIFKEIPTD